MSEDPQSIGGGFRWDPSINAGAIIAMLGIAGTVVGTGSVALNRLNELETSMIAQGQNFDARLKAVEDSLVLFRVDLAKRDGIESKVNDHEERIRNLERAR